ncbi:MAG: MMPL family transporter, partial [Chitinivibrionales bacterium]|nr:MMPL family transporter [Chitinivibrionales bacterium]
MRQRAVLVSKGPFDGRRWTVLLLRRRRLWVAAICLLSAAAATGISMLRVTYDHRAFFSRSTPLLQRQEHLQRLYGTDRNVYFCMVSRSGSVFTPENIRSLRTLVSAATELPSVSQVASILSYKRVRPGILGPRLVSVLADSGAPRPDTLMELARELTAEPLLQGRLVSESGHAAGVFATVDIPDSNRSAAAAIARDARAIADAVSAANQDIDIYVTGGVLLDVAFSEAAADDMVTLAPLMLLVVTAVVLLLFRSMRLAAAILSVVVLAACAAMGVAGWAGIAITPPVAVVPVIVLTVGIADSIHLVTAFLHARHKGRGPVWSLITALRQTAAPIAVTSLAALAGFANLNTSEVPPFRHMGNSVCVGVAWCYALTMVLLPLLLVGIRVPARRERRHGLLGTTLGIFVSKHAFALSLTVLVAAGAAVSGIRMIRFDDTFIDYFSSRYRFRTDTDATVAELSGIDYVECSIAAPPDSGIRAAGYLTAVDSVGADMRRLPSVRHVLSLPLVLRTAAAGLRSDTAADTRLPGDGLRRLLLERLLGGAEGRSAFPPVVSTDTAQTRLVATLGKVSAAQLRLLESRLQDGLRSRFADGRYTIGGISLLFAHLARRNTISMLAGIALTLVAAVLLVTLVSRSLVLGFVSLVPNIAPAAIAAGLWGYLFGTAGLGVSVAAAMTLGVIVDDTIHFLYGFLGARRDCRCSAREAIALAFRHVADA